MSGRRAVVSAVLAVQKMLCYVMLQYKSHFSYPMRCARAWHSLGVCQSSGRARAPASKCQIHACQIFGASRAPSVPVKTRRPPRPPRASLALARRRASALNRPKTRPTAAKRDRTPEPPPCSFSVVRSTPTASLENRASSRAPSPCTLRASRSTSAHAQCPQRLGPGSQASHGPTAVHLHTMHAYSDRPTHRRRHPHELAPLLAARGLHIHTHSDHPTHSRRHPHTPRPILLHLRAQTQGSP